MFKKLVPINAEVHKNVKIKPLDSFDFAKGFHLASVTVSEFPRVASTYPIVFIKSPDGNEFKPVALFSLKENDNSFIVDGKWDAPYIPSILRRYPFSIAPLNKDEENSFAVCVDEESTCFNEEEGLALFNEEGKPTEFLDGVREFLTDMQKQEVMTMSYCQLLDKHGLLKEQSLDVKLPNGQNRRIGGFYLLDEKAFKDLSDQVFLEFRHKGALDAIYSQLSSISQLSRLSRIQKPSAAPADAKTPETADA